MRAAACHPQRGTARSGGGGACGVNLDSSDSDDSSVGAAARRPQHGTAHSGSGGSCGVKLVRDALGNPLVTAVPPNLPTRRAKSISDTHTTYHHVRTLIASAAALCRPG